MNRWINVYTLGGILFLGLLSISNIYSQNVTEEQVIAVEQVACEKASVKEIADCETQAVEPDVESAACCEMSAKGICSLEKKVAIHERKARLLENLQAHCQELLSVQCQIDMEDLTSEEPSEEFMNLYKMTCSIYRQGKTCDQQVNQLLSQLSHFSPGHPLLQEEMDEEELAPSSLTQVDEVNDPSGSVLMEIGQSGINRSDQSSTIVKLVQLHAQQAKKSADEAKQAVEEVKSLVTQGKRPSTIASSSKKGSSAGGVLGSLLLRESGLNVSDLLQENTESTTGSDAGRIERIQRFLTELNAIKNELTDFLSKESEQETKSVPTVEDETVNPSKTTLSILENQSPSTDSSGIDPSGLFNQVIGTAQQ